ncbi:MAG: hypothetical protein AMXMBFR64_05050 [Myxococcales bacterium]
MAVQVPQSQAFTFELYPARPAASASAVVRNAAGKQLAGGAATLDSVSTTLGAVDSRQAVTVAVRAGIVPGRRYWVVSKDSEELYDLVTVEGVTPAVVGAGGLLDLGPGGHRLPGTGDRLLGARLTLAVSSSVTATRGMNGHVMWSVTDRVASVYAVQRMFDVVRCLFDLGVTPADVRRYLSVRAGSFALTADQDPSRYEDVAERATAMVQDRIRAVENYPSLVGDPTAFREANRCAMKIALTDEGIIEDVADRRSYVDGLYERLDADIAQALRVCWYDKNDDAVVQPSEVRRRSIVGVR